MTESSPRNGPLRRRSLARMLALQALCVYEAVGEPFRERLAAFLRDEVILEDLGIDEPPGDDVLTFARALVDGAWARRPGYDTLLNETVPQWTVSRMTPVDRNVLRLGLYELLDARQAPPQIILNEAIELARCFGDANSPAFVNGVLDAVRRAAVAASSNGESDAAEQTSCPEGNDVGPV